MAAVKIGLDEVPDDLRIKARNDFINDALKEWSEGRGLVETGIHATIARSIVAERREQSREFNRKHFPEQHDERPVPNIGGYQQPHAS